MRGTPKPTWSQGRHVWLAALRDGSQSPTRTPHRLPAYSCRVLGWTRFVPGTESHEELTEAGRVTLEQWDRAPVGMPTAPVSKGFAVTGLTPVELASKLLEAGRGQAMAVFEALHVGLFGTMPEPREGGTVRALREAVASGELVGADPGLEVGGTQHGPEPVETVMDAGEVVAPAATAPPRLTAHLGKRVPPRNYTECLRCRGHGTVAHGFVCPACHGAGTIKRTVEP